MKIAIACCGLGHVRRGIEVWADDLARLLYGKGIDVTLFKGGGRVEKPYEVVVPCLKRDSPLTKFLTKWRFRGVWRTPFTAPYPLESWTFALNLKRFLRNRYDIINVQDPLVARHLSKWKRKGNIKPKVIFANGTETPVDAMKEYDFIQELDDYDIANLVKAGHPRTNLYVVPNFVDTNIFRPGDRSAERRRFGIPEDAYVVLSVGAIERGFKRMDYVINEFAMFRRSCKRKTFLLIAGATTGETDELRKMAAQKFGDNFRFLENLSHSEMSHVYRAADVFAFCVTHGIYGIAVAEAAATGLSCILHDWFRVKWVGGPSAIVLDLSKEGELAKGMEKCLDEKYRITVSISTRDWAVNTISADVIIGKYIEMYEDILSIKRNGN